jgi:hypothetical protein
MALLMIATALHLPSGRNHTPCRQVLTVRNRPSLIPAPNGHLDSVAFGQHSICALAAKHTGSNALKPAKPPRISSKIQHTERANGSDQTPSRSNRLYNVQNVP